MQKEFLASSLWLIKQKFLPTKREKVNEYKFGIVPRSFKAKVPVPCVIDRDIKRMGKLR